MTARILSVLFVTTSFPRFQGDFAGSFVFRFAKYLARAGVRVTVLAPGAAGYLTTDTMHGIHVYRFPYFYPQRLQCLAYEGGGMLANLRTRWLAMMQLPFFFLATVWAIIRHQEDVDLIHCHWLPTAVATLVARRLSRRKPAAVLTCWGSDMRQLPAGLARWTLARVDGYISPGVEADESDAYLQSVGYTNFCRITTPVDEEQFCRASVATDMRHELGIAEHIPVLPFIGRLDDFKDPLTFIRACAILKQQGIPFVAPMAGDGGLMAACQHEVQRHDLQDCVILLGVRTDPERLLRIATATVHISPVENVWANAIAEAMFMDVPVILSDAGYTAQLFTHAQDCFIVPAQDPPALAVSLRRLIDDAPLRQSLATGARELLRRQKKDSASIVQATLAYYHKILSRKETHSYYG